jgi:hypothetical protein
MNHALGVAEYLCTMKYVLFHRVSTGRTNCSTRRGGASPSPRSSSLTSSADSASDSLFRPSPPICWRMASSCRRLSCIEALVLARMNVTSAWHLQQKKTVTILQYHFSQTDYGKRSHKQQLST